MVKIEHSYQNDCSTSTLNYSNDEFGNYNSPNGQISDVDAKSSSPSDCSTLNLANKINHEHAYPTPESTENSNQSDDISSLLNFPNGCVNFSMNNNSNINFEEFNPGHTKFLNNDTNFEALVTYNLNAANINYLPNTDLIHNQHHYDYNQNINLPSNDINQIVFEQNFANKNFYLMSKIREDNEQSKNILENSNAGSSNEADEANQSIIEQEPDKIELNRNQKNKTIKQTKTSKTEPNYLMQPPDSDLIAAATEQHKINRTRRRTRTKFDEKQLEILEKTFQRVHYPDVSVVDRMCNMLNLTPERIAVWFQNRRARFKKSKKDPTTSSSFDTIQDNETMLREVEKLLDGDNLTESLNISSEKVSKSKKTNAKKVNKASNEQKPSQNEKESITLTNNEITKDDQDLKKSNSKQNQKPIFNPMSYSPNNSLNTTANPAISQNYHIYPKNESLAMTNIIQMNNQHDYYRYAAQSLLQSQDTNFQHKLPITGRTDSKQDNTDIIESDSPSPKSSRSSTPNSNDSSSSPEQLQNQDSNENNNNNSNNNTSDFSANSNYQTNMFGEINGHNYNTYQNMSYYHPAHYNPNLLQSYYNLSDFQNNSYLSGIYSQFQNVASSYQA